jgi:hypothetical protein
MNHHTTRLAEGFHQEVKQAYSQTNGKNEDPQVRYQHQQLDIDEKKFSWHE